jgi:cell filamentation protein
LTRKEYDTYLYIDNNGKYTYPNTSILINNFGVQKSDIIDELEYEIIGMKLLELQIFPFRVKNTNDILTLHKHLFQDLYVWAGNYREVNISKSGKAFIAIQSFNTAQIYMDLLIQDYYKNANTQYDLTVYLAKILDSLNYFHPFRDGNGRTQREVIRLLALEKNYNAQIKIEADVEIYNLYMDGTVYGDIEKLEKLFQRILTKIRD